MSKLLSAISSAFVFGTVLATSPTAFADSYGDQYRGKTRCSDDLTMTVVHRYFSDKDSTFLRDSRVNPMTLNKTWAGKLTMLKSSVWMQAEKSTDTSGPSNIVLEKTEDGSAGINLLVCSYEFVPNEKTKVFLVNESIFRMSHDAQKGDRKSVV